MAGMAVVQTGSRGSPGSHTGDFRLLCLSGAASWEVGQRRDVSD